jgi:hypothetical protein
MFNLRNLLADINLMLTKASSTSIKDGVPDGKAAV